MSGLWVAAEKGGSAVASWPLFAWGGLAGVLLLARLGSLLAARPGLLGGPVGLLMRVFDSTPQGASRRVSLHEEGIGLAYLGLAWCVPAVILTATAFTLRDATLAVIVGVAICLLLSPLYLLGWRRLVA